MPERRRVKSAARKQPRQARSKATVDALLEATARLLARDGYEGASTNRIAEVAGVNVGSLYQYFPGKEALIAALIDRHLEELATELERGLRAAPHSDLQQAVRALVAAHLRAHASAPELHRALVLEVPRVERSAPIAALLGRLIMAVQGFLASRPSEVRVADPERAAFIVVHTVDALTRAALLYAPERLDEPGYADDVARLVAGFLAGR